MPQELLATTAAAVEMPWVDWRLAPGRRHHVMHFGAIRMAAVLDRADVVGRPDDTLGVKESCGERLVVARRPHDDRERLSVQPNVERLLRRGGVLGDDAAAVTRADDLYPADRRQRRWRRDVS